MNIPVFIISGNHDSAPRLSCCNKLMSDRGVYISSSYDGTEQKVTIADEYGNVNIYLLPFVKPANVKHYLSEDEAEKIASYHDAVTVAITRLNVDTAERNIIVTHQFVTGAERCESEDVHRMLVAKSIFVIAEHHLSILFLRRSRKSLLQ